MKNAIFPFSAKIVRRNCFSIVIYSKRTKIYRENCLKKPRNTNSVVFPLCKKRRFFFGDFEKNNIYMHFRTKKAYFRTKVTQKSIFDL